MTHYTPQEWDPCSTGVTLLISPATLSVWCMIQFDYDLMLRSPHHNSVTWFVWWNLNWFKKTWWWPWMAERCFDINSLEYTSFISYKFCFWLPSHLSSLPTQRGWHSLRVLWSWAVIFKLLNYTVLWYSGLIMYQPLIRSVGSNGKPAVPITTLFITNPAWRGTEPKALL